MILLNWVATNTWRSESALPGSHCSHGQPSRNFGATIMPFEGTIDFVMS